MSALFIGRVRDLGTHSLYWPGADDEPRRRYGLGGPDPTAPVGDEPDL